MDQPHAGADAHPRPPWVFWLIPLAVAALRAIPFFISRLIALADESIPAPVSYNQIDSLAYVGFIRQAAETGDWLLTNPHTTLPQDGRYILPLFALLGHLSRWTGIDPFWVFEMSRVPLIFIFFATLWYFLAPLVPQLRPRMLVAGLVGFAGGVEFLVWSTLKYWPGKWHATAAEALSDDQGWNTFASLSNPLWAAGLTLTLVALRPILDPAGERRFRDWCQVGLGFFAAYYVHPYSGLVVGGVAVLLPVARWLLGAGGDARYWRGAVPALGIPAAFIAAISVWQTKDDVFRITAERVLGDHQLSVFWYPFALGGLLFLAVRGWARFIRDRAPVRVTVGAWTLIIIFLHTSPLINGYHFVFHLHIPVCIAAGAALDEILQRYRSMRGAGRVAGALLLFLLFQSPLGITWRSLKRALGYQIPKPVMAAVQRLAQEPAGAVYTAPHIGTLLPALTPHRVYVGHWFLTPDFEAKQRYFRDLLAGQAEAAPLVQLIQKERIRYVLLPPGTPPHVLEALAPLVARSEMLGNFILIYLR